MLMDVQIIELEVQPPVNAGDGNSLSIRKMKDIRRHRMRDSVMVAILRTLLL